MKLIAFRCTQRKLRTFEKKQDSMQKSMDADAIEEAIDFTLRQPENDDEQTKHINEVAEEQKESSAVIDESSGDNICIAENGMYMLPKNHPDHTTLIKLQLENQVKCFILRFSISYI
jgi:uncharacterized membrane protein